jgi:hypothetical protein
MSYSHRSGKLTCRRSFQGLYRSPSTGLEGRRQNAPGRSPAAEQPSVLTPLGGQCHPDGVLFDLGVFLGPFGVADGAPAFGLREGLPAGATGAGFFDELAP